MNSDQLTTISFKQAMWVGKDSNLRRQLSTDLQSVAFDRFATYPAYFIYSIFPAIKSLKIY